MENLKHLEQIKDEMKCYELTVEDLTEEELCEIDAEIETISNGGFVMDGIRSRYGEFWRRKMDELEK